MERDIEKPERRITDFEREREKPEMIRDLQRQRKQSKRMRYFERDIEKTEIRMRSFPMVRKEHKLEIMRTDFEREGEKPERRRRGFQRKKIALSNNDHRPSERMKTWKET